MRERGLYSPKFNKLNKSKMLSAKRSREFHSSGTSTPSIDTSRDSYLAFNPNIDLRILAIVLLSLVPALVYPYTLNLTLDEMKYTKPR